MSLRLLWSALGAISWAAVACAPSATMPPETAAPPLALAPGGLPALLNQEKRELLLVAEREDGTVLERVAFDSGRARVSVLVDPSTGSPMASDLAGGKLYVVAQELAHAPCGNIALLRSSTLLRCDADGSGCERTRLELGLAQAATFAAVDEARGQLVIVGYEAVLDPKDCRGEPFVPLRMALCDLDGSRCTASEFYPQAFEPLFFDRARRQILICDTYPMMDVAAALVDVREPLPDTCSNDEWTAEEKRQCVQESVPYVGMRDFVHPMMAGDTRGPVYFDAARRELGVLGFKAVEPCDGYPCANYEERLTHLSCHVDTRQCVAQPLDIARRLAVLGIAASATRVAFVAAEDDAPENGKQAVQWITCSRDRGQCEARAVEWRGGDPGKGACEARAALFALGDDAIVVQFREFVGVCTAEAGRPCVLSRITGAAR